MHFIYKQGLKYGKYGGYKIAVLEIVNYCSSTIAYSSSIQQFAWRNIL